jgi:hypothetical protein
MKLRFVGEDPSRNWPEADDDLDSKIYMNRCFHCEYLFMGWKGRIVCKQCANKEEL